MGVTTMHVIITRYETITVTPETWASDTFILAMGGPPPKQMWGHMECMCACVCVCVSGQSLAEVSSNQFVSAHKGTPDL